MGTLSPDEDASFAMNPIWESLDAVRAQHQAMRQFLREELPVGTNFDVAGMNAALALATEFSDIWPHRVPTRWELVQADRAGQLKEKIAELNQAYTSGN